MNLKVLDPSYLSKEVTSNLLRWVQDVKLKLDTALKGAGVSSLVAGSGIKLTPSTGLGDVTLSILVPLYGVGAPVGASVENQFYFDTTGSPYHGYIYHSGAWQQFS